MTNHPKVKRATQKLHWTPPKVNRSFPHSSYYSSPRHSRTHCSPPSSRGQAAASGALRGAPWRCTRQRCKGKGFKARAKGFKGKGQDKGKGNGEGPSGKGKGKTGNVPKGNAPEVPPDPTRGAPGWEPIRSEDHPNRRQRRDRQRRQNRRQAAQDSYFA